MAIKDFIIANIPAPLLLRMVAAHDFLRGEPELHLLKRLVPRDRVALDVRDSHDRVVERGKDVHLSGGQCALYLADSRSASR